MNAPAAAKHAGRRAARYNLWAGVVVLAAFAVLAVKAQTAENQVPARHFTPLWSTSATCTLMADREGGRKALDFSTKSHASSC